MKLGNWINISAVLLASISAQAMASEETPKETTETTKESKTISKAELAKAITELKSGDKPGFKGTPCFSVPTKQD